jgi:hypothetical protein
MTGLVVRHTHAQFLLAVKKKIYDQTIEEETKDRERESR